MSKQCTLSREEVISIIHNVEILYEFYLERMTGVNAETRMRISEARNKIHLVLQRANGQPREGGD